MSGVADALVIIPTYKEAENIGAIISAVMALTQPFDILVVDDGSPDGTPDLVREKQQQYPGRVFMLERAGKLGLGTAYITGFRWGLEQGYQYLLEMDADFSHPVDKLTALRELCSSGAADLSVGSRYTRGGGVVNWSWDRHILSYGASLYVRLVTGMPVKDPTAGFVCYSRRVLEALDLSGIKFIGYAFQIEMKFRAFQQGFRLKELPIIFKDREAGVSKMNVSIISEAILGVLKMRFGR